MEPLGKGTLKPEPLAHGAGESEAIPALELVLKPPRLPYRTRASRCRSLRTVPKAPCTFIVDT